MGGQSSKVTGGHWSAPGQNRKSSMRSHVFRFALGADIAQQTRHVRFVPTTEVQVGLLATCFLAPG